MRGYLKLSIFFSKFLDSQQDIIPQANSSLHILTLTNTDRIPFLFKDNIYGTVEAGYGIKPNDMTEEVWDYVFGISSVVPKDTKVPKSTLDEMLRSFSYFYPLDYRVSGKE
jgi:leucyl-tRNA synthetase